MRRTPIVAWIALCVAGAIPRFTDLWFYPSPLSSRDFSSFYIAGRLGSAAYNATTAEAYARSLFGHGLHLPFAYPPHLLPFLAIFGALPYALSFVLWSVGGVAFFTWAARPFMRGVPLWVLPILPATLVCLEFGQIALWIGGLWFLAFRDKAWALSLLTIKPHIGALAGIRAIENKRLILPAAAFLCVFVGVSVLLFGVESWRAFFASLAGQSRIAPPHDKFISATIYGPIGYTLFALTATVLALRNFNVFTGATAAILVSPYCFHYDLTAASAGFAVLLSEAEQPWQKLIAALGLLSPALTVLGSEAVPPILLACLFVQSFAMKRE